MPIEVELKTDGLDAIIGRLGKADKVVRDAAFAVKANAQREIQAGSKSGKLYKRGKRGVHQASAPGQAPATDSGHLANSIQTRKVADAEHEVTVGAEYAAALEDGKDRPFLGPAVDKARAGLEAAVKKLFDE